MPCNDPDHMDYMRQDAIFQLATILYADLPFWKRWKITKFYCSNNWDVTGEWAKCIKAATKMLVDFESLTNGDYNGTKR